MQSYYLLAEGEVYLHWPDAWRCRHICQPPGSVAAWCSSSLEVHQAVHQAPGVLLRVGRGLGEETEVHIKFIPVKFRSQLTFNHR